MWPLSRRVGRTRSRVSVMACCGVGCDVSSMIESSVVRFVGFWWCMLRTVRSVWWYAVLNRDVLVLVRLNHVAELYMWVEVTSAAVYISFVVVGSFCLSMYFRSGASELSLWWLRCVSSGCMVHVGVIMVPRCLYCWSIVIVTLWIGSVIL